ncbi:cobaltochelatase subunit CobN [Cupriavidus basilensis]
MHPRRARLLRKAILKLIVDQQLHRELGLEAPADSDGEDALLNPLSDAYLCELKESQIRDGLHVFGACRRRAASGATRCLRSGAFRWATARARRPAC